MATVFLVFLLAHLGAAYEPYPRWNRIQQIDKAYAVVRAPRLMSIDMGKVLCEVVGGNLPEPRSEEENRYLSEQLDTRTFLGINDKVDEGLWRFDSDGTLVYWANWQQWQHDEERRQHPEPNGNRTENCAMLLNLQSICRYNDRYTWADTECHSRSVDNIVCQWNESCSNKMRNCYFRRHIYNIIAPKVTQICGAFRFIDRCLDETECDSSEEHRKWSHYFKQYNHEICELEISWSDWEVTTNKTCKNDKSKELATMEKMMRCKALFNANLMINDCDKVNLAYNCMVNDVTDVCAYGLAKEHMKELMRATARAMNATIYKFYTQHTYHCNVTIP